VHRVLKEIGTSGAATWQISNSFLVNVAKTVTNRDHEGVGKGLAKPDHPILGLVNHLRSVPRYLFAALGKLGKVGAIQILPLVSK
jgi:hypothetical protein